MLKDILNRLRTALFEPRWNEPQGLSHVNRWDDRGLSLATIYQGLSSDRDYDREMAVWCLNRRKLYGDLRVYALATDSSLKVQHEVAMYLRGSVNRGPLPEEVLQVMLRMGEFDQELSANLAVPIQRATSLLKGGIDFETTEAIVKRLRSEATVVRVNAARALVGNDMSLAVTALIFALSDDDVGVRRAALWALSRSPLPASLDAIRSCLKDKHPNVRRQAIYALRRRLGAEADEQLTALIVDNSAKVRKAVLRAVGPRLGRALLESAVEDSHPGVSLAARRQLDSIRTLASDE